ncbi:MAG: hypothetical protein QXJ68_00775 [Methanocellales archaeon]
MTSDLELLRRWKSRLGSQLVPPKVTFCPIEKKMVEVAKNCSTCIFAKVGTDDFPYCEYEYMERI